MPSQQNCLPSQKATVGSLATGARSATLPHARGEVVERIKKCLARADHVNANGNEARAAIKMASQIMQQHNITQAQIMEDEDDAQRLKRGGLSTVNIDPRTQDRQVIFETWVIDLKDAICTFFDCKAFSSQSFSSIEFTFYGVVEHTASAAMAVELTHNLIQNWAWPLHGVCARNSYCLGVAHGLKDIAKAEQRAAESAAKENEAKSTAAKTTPSSTHLQRPSVMEFASGEDSSWFADSDDILGPCIAPVERFMGTEEGEYESEDISNNDSVLADFNDEDSYIPDVTASFEAGLEKFAKATSGPSKDQITSEPNQAEWTSSMQLTIYRQNVAKITKDVLKAKNVTLYARRKIHRSIKDKKQYAQGVEDSKKINVRGARTENGRAWTIKEN